MNFVDYYATLGVKKEASQKEIRSAFRKLARKHHPDVNPGNAEAEARFKEINEANEVLSDPERRKVYDALGSRWREYEQYRAAGGTGTPTEFARAEAGSADGASGGSAPGGFAYRTASEDDLRDLFGQESPFSDFFSDLFGSRAGAGGRGQNRPVRGADVEVPVTIDLEHAYRGGVTTLRLVDPDGSERVIEATIPRGVRDGSRVRLAGQGQSGRNGGSHGDLYMVVEVYPDARFRRHGDDLRVEVPVELTTCVLGGEVQVQTLKGTHLAVRIPPETQNGQAIRLRGQGMPHLKHPETAGDLYVEVTVILPQGLSDEERALFVRLRELRQGTAAGGTRR